MPADPTLERARSGDERAFEELLAPHIRELRAHCYRLLASIHEVDDVMQESLLKAWQGLPAFEGRSGLRTWLYKIVTNVCLDAADKRPSRLLPANLGPPANSSNDPIAPTQLEPAWLEPCPADWYRAVAVSPEAQYDSRQSVALAFLTAIQLLPAKQRGILILHDVVGLQSSEIGEALDLSVAAVNSALQRARATLTSREGKVMPETPQGKDAELLSQYVAAWEQADVDKLVALLLKDATLSMPPLPQWISGADAIGISIGSMVFSPAGPGAFRLYLTEANGVPAFAAYQLDRDNRVWRAMALQLVETLDGRIAAITAFLNPSLFAKFDLPETIAEG